MHAREQVTRSEKVVMSEHFTREKCARTCFRGKVDMVVSESEQQAKDHHKVIGESEEADNDKCEEE